MLLSDPPAFNQPCWIGGSFIWLDDGITLKSEQM